MTVAVRNVELTIATLLRFERYIAAERDYAILRWWTDLRRIESVVRRFKNER